MRPAQKAPENPECPGAMTHLVRRFNEAGAKSAGKHARERKAHRQMIQMLQ